MKIRMYFGKAKLAVLIIVLLGALAIMGLDIALLSGAVYSASDATSAVSLAASVIIAVMSLLVMCNSYYKFCDDKFIAVIGFFVDKVSYDSVVAVKQNIATRELFIIVDAKQSQKRGGYVEKSAMTLSLTDAKADAFLVELKNHLPSLTVEYFSLPKKQK